MKNILIPVLCIFTQAAYSQNNSTDIIKDAIVVNNIQIGEKYRMADLLAAFGENPTEILKSTEENSFANAYEIRYGKDRFSYIEGEFYAFTIWTGNYAVNNYIRVGDHVSRIKDLGGIARCESGEYGNTVDWRPSTEGIYGCTYISFTYDDKGIITVIDVPILL